MIRQTSLGNTAKRATFALPLGHGACPLGVEFAAAADVVCHPWTYLPSKMVATCPHFRSQLARRHHTPAPRRRQASSDPMPLTLNRSPRPRRPAPRARHSPVIVKSSSHPVEYSPALLTANTEPEHASMMTGRIFEIL